MMWWAAVLTKKYFIHFRPAASYPAVTTLNMSD
jgi:hypothetical protein